MVIIVLVEDCPGVANDLDRAQAHTSLNCGKGSNTVLIMAFLVVANGLDRVQAHRSRNCGSRSEGSIQF